MIIQTSFSKEGNYSIYVGNSSIRNCFETLDLSLKKFILVDENTERFCLPLLFEKAPHLKENSEIINISSGELHKNLHSCELIWNKLTTSGADRKSILINLGGGVICDMGGFIASTYKRGIDFINIPTTLLAMTDASFGGKTGIDFVGLKNQLGVFANPKAVVIDTELLKTLEQRQIKNGFAEIIKHALIDNWDYWEKIKNIIPESYIDWTTIIEESIKIKLTIIEQDPFEQNIRKKLNFGHTIGHAIESWSLEYDVNPLLHGEAVVIGIICESYLSNKTHKLSESAFREIINYISSIYPSYDFDEKIIPQLTTFMKHDKKNSGTTINFSLLSDIGTCDIDKTCEEKLIQESLEIYYNISVKTGNTMKIK